MGDIEYWQDLTTTALGDLDTESTVALLPVAAIEQHGPHLPLSTDLEINRGILDSALGRLEGGARVLVLPEQPIGDSLEHLAFPGTLSLRPELLLELWTEIGHGIARAGLRKLVIFNSHGGQTGLVDQAALRLRAERSMLVARASYFAFGTPAGLFEQDELSRGLHGGEVETSLMLALRPDLVRRDALEDFQAPGPGTILGPERPVGFGWLSQDLNPAGVCGNAARADAERGRRLLEHLGGRLAALLLEMVRTPLSTLRDGPPTR